MTRSTGKTLYQIAAESNPWLSADPKRDALERYRREMEEKPYGNTQPADQVHRSDVYGDFHPKNILVTEDGAVSFRF